MQKIVLLFCFQAIISNNLLSKEIKAYMYIVASDPAKNKAGTGDETKQDIKGVVLDKSANNGAGYGDCHPCEEGCATPVLIPYNIWIQKEAFF